MLGFGIHLTTIHIISWRYLSCSDSFRHWMYQLDTTYTEMITICTRTFTDIYTQWCLHTTLSTCKTTTTKKMFIFALICHTSYIPSLTYIFLLAVFPILLVWLFSLLTVWWDVLTTGANPQRAWECLLQKYPRPSECLPCLWHSLRGKDHLG